MTEPRKKLRPPAPIVKNGRRDETIPTAGAQDFATQEALPIQKTRAYFREEEFTRVLRQQGKYILWRKALLCPCRSAESDQPLLGCPDCGGAGFLYINPLHIQALVLQFDKRTSMFEKFGIWQEGNVQITTEPQHRLGFRDSLEMLDTRAPMNELIEKGDRRGRKAALPAGVDCARFRILDLTSALYRCEKSGKLISLEKGVHFEITPEGWLRWLSSGDRAVPKGGIVSIHYDWHPIFMVLTWMHIERSAVTGRKAPPGTNRVISLPMQAGAKLMFLVNAAVVPSLDPIIERPSGWGPGGTENA